MWFGERSEIIGRPETPSGLREVTQGKKFIDTSQNEKQVLREAYCFKHYESTSEAFKGFIDVQNAFAHNKVYFLKFIFR